MLSPEQRAFERFHTASDSFQDGTPSIQLSPATYLVAVQADPCGGVFYQLDSLAPRVFQLGEEFADARLGVIETLRASWILDEKTDQLRAICGSHLGNQRIFLFGPLWGVWIDESGRRFKSHDFFSLMRSSGLAADIDPRTLQITVDFNINIHVREALAEPIPRNIQSADHDHQISLTFECPSGKFLRAQLSVNRRTGSGAYSEGFRTFPLIWPTRIREQSAYNPMTEPNSNAPRSDASGTGFIRIPRENRAKLKPTATPVPEEPDASSRIRLKPRSAGVETPPIQPPPPSTPPTATPPIQPTPPPREPESARTSRLKLRPTESRGPQPTPTPDGRTHKRGSLTTAIQELPIDEAVELISAEPDLLQRWKMIEANLILGRPERTYTLIRIYTELIGARTVEWPSPRLKTAFGWLPGGVLVDIMRDWAVNQVLAVAEENPEPDRILEWLQTREVGRLLELQIDQEITTASMARRELNVDKTADAQEVKKVWRMLLKFLNPDLGRREERAIHRRKDEIAKYLQEARNVLLRKM